MTSETHPARPLVDALVTCLDVLDEDEGVWVYRTSTVTADTKGT